MGDVDKDFIWPQLATTRVIDTLQKILLDAGPPILAHNVDHGKNHPSEQRLQAPGDENHRRGPRGEHNSHREGRALDIVLFSQSPKERAEAYELIRVFREQQATMQWSEIIYNKEYWTPSGGPYPRIFPPPTTEQISDPEKKKTYEENKAGWEHITHVHIEWLLKDKDYTEYATALTARLKLDLALDATLEALPATLDGQWKVVWGNNDYTGHMKFDKTGGVAFSEQANGAATNRGRWDADSGALNFRFTGDPGDIRTFVVALPIDPTGAPGVILPVGQGWFNMSKLS